MEPKKKLQDIFDDDPFDLLKVKPNSSRPRNPDERLVASFQEINDFFETHQREPQAGGHIQEHLLYSRLSGLRSDPLKVDLLKEYDRFRLFDVIPKTISTIQDIFDDDPSGLLDDDAEGLYDLTYIGDKTERASADFVARRKPCVNFEDYEASFRLIQADLANGNRKLIPSRQENLRAGDYYVYNGILLYLEQVDFEEDVQEYKSGPRLRKDGRTRVIFENGTESNMLYRSLYKALLANGKAVTENAATVQEKFIEKFSSITAEDREAGYIYILKSKSDKPEIKAIKNLYKIGYSKIEVEDRIKNASQEPTYLMADVRIVMAYKCFNMIPQKLEQLLHNFFGSACLNVDVFDNAGQRHIPREWFIAPLDIIEQAVQLIISREIVDFRYDAKKEIIISRR